MPKPKARARKSKRSVPRGQAAEAGRTRAATSFGPCHEPPGAELAVGAIPTTSRGTGTRASRTLLPPSPRGDAPPFATSVLLRTEEEVLSFIDDLRQALRRSQYTGGLYHCGLKDTCASIDIQVWVPFKPHLSHKGTCR